MPPPPPPQLSTSLSPPNKDTQSDADDDGGRDGGQAKPTRKRAPRKTSKTSADTPKTSRSRSGSSGGSRRKSAKDAAAYADDSSKDLGGHKGSTSCQRYPKAGNKQLLAPLSNSPSNITQVYTTRDGGNEHRHPVYGIAGSDSATVAGNAGYGQEKGRGNLSSLTGSKFRSDASDANVALLRQSVQPKMGTRLPPEPYSQSPHHARHSSTRYPSTQRDSEVFDHDSRSYAALEERVEAHIASRLIQDMETYREALNTRHVANVRFQDDVKNDMNIMKKGCQSGMEGVVHGLNELQGTMDEIKAHMNAHIGELFSDRDADRNVLSLLVERVGKIEQTLDTLLSPEWEAFQQERLRKVGPGNAIPHAPASPEIGATNTSETALESNSEPLDKESQGDQGGVSSPMLLSSQPSSQPPSSLGGQQVSHDNQLVPSASSVSVSDASLQHLPSTKEKPPMSSLSDMGQSVPSAPAPSSCVDRIEADQDQQSTEAPKVITGEHQALVLDEDDPVRLVSAADSAKSRRHQKLSPSDQSSDNPPLKPPPQTVTILDPVPVKPKTSKVGDVASTDTVANRISQCASKKRPRESEEMREPPGNIQVAETPTPKSNRLSSAYFRDHAGNLVCVRSFQMSLGIDRGIGRRPSKNRKLDS